jgi:hypothetical protein
MAAAVPSAPGQPITVCCLQPCPAPQASPSLCVYGSVLSAGMLPALEACQARALQLLPLATNWCCYAMDQAQQATTITINASNISYNHTTGD